MDAPGLAADPPRNGLTKTLLVTGDAIALPRPSQFVGGPTGVGQRRNGLAPIRDTLAVFARAAEASFQHAHGPA